MALGNVDWGSTQQGSQIFGEGGLGLRSPLHGFGRPDSVPKHLSIQQPRLWVEVCCPVDGLWAFLSVVMTSESLEQLFSAERGRAAIPQIVVAFRAALLGTYPCLYELIDG
jgi:hypothetical protein